MPSYEGSGPHVGQIVLYSESGTVIYPALIVSINSDGTVRLNTFKPGVAMADQNNVIFDYTRTKSGSWSWPTHSLSGI